ncbi:hypothetical protein NQZ68_003141 [Dissostichus eleginoides]|nr:hypothetical protein NQZ68_003141 [Dissostichus eleginoides]
MMVLSVLSAHSVQREEGDIQPGEVSHGRDDRQMIRWDSEPRRNESIAGITTAFVFNATTSLNPNKLINYLKWETSPARKGINHAQRELRSLITDSTSRRPNQSKP